ncbi:hypothetical protein Bhz59_00090 [Stenotrophomonas phage vB_SmaS_Bhz59]
MAPKTSKPEGRLLARQHITYAEPEPARRLLRDLDMLYPRANLENSWWLGHGLIEVRDSYRRRILLEGFWIAPNRRNLGHGAAMLDTLTGLADRHGVAIDTWADRYDVGKVKTGLRNGELREWYARWGFKPHPTRKGWLRREPRRAS